MRWKLIRRRLSISAPRMIVRSHLPWPLRWVVIALALGFSAAVALWAFEIGKEIAGLERGSKQEVQHLRLEVEQLRAESLQLREERDRAQSIANTAGSLLTAEKATTEQLAQQLKRIEADNLALKGDLGFFERLLPAAEEGPSVRALQVETIAAGQLKFQLLVMIAGKTQGEFNGRYELQLDGTLENKPWTFSPPSGAQPLRFRQYVRAEGLVEYPALAVVRTVQVRVIDSAGKVRANRSVKL